MAFTVVNFCGSPVGLEKYQGGDKASLALDSLLIVALISLVCLSVIGKIDVGLGEVRTLANPWTQGLIGAACGIFVLDMITAVVKSRSLTPTKPTPQTSFSINEVPKQRNPSSLATGPVPLNPHAKATGNIEILKEQANHQIRVSVGQLFAIKLSHSYSTGHQPWVMSTCPPFISMNNITKITPPYVVGMVGNGSWYVFEVQARTQGKGNIIMKMPCSFHPTRETTLSFPIEVT